ncbi:hypothetical protein BDR06DRAFT_962702 [Suillus hirtellus]|nr:hypothetical protein BDR06DRAFT_962702 [Suillus hirtellus]
MIIVTDSEDEDALRTLQIASNQSGLLRFERNSVFYRPGKDTTASGIFKLNGLYRRLVDHDSVASFSLLIFNLCFVLIPTVQSCHLLAGMMTKT